MVSEWKTLTLESIVTLQRGHDLPTPKRIKGNIPIMGSFGITGWHNESKSKGPGVTIGRSGGSMGVVNFIDTDYWPLNTTLYVKDFLGNDPFFIYLFLSQIDFWTYNSGSAQPSLNRNLIYGIELNLPSLPEQKAIAHILGCLDDKIELNRQMNQTLEQMAQALFKSWFVDFDPVLDNAIAAGCKIPDALKERAEQRQELGEDKKTLPEHIQKLFPSEFEFNEDLDKWIPKGWEVGVINEATSLIIDHRGKTPKKLGGDWSVKGYPAISAKNIKGGRIVNHEQIRFLNSDLYYQWMKNELQEGDVLMTSEAPMGEMYFLARDKKYCLSQRMFALRSSEKISPSYLYCWLQTDIAISDMEGRASGTTVTGIKQSELRKVKIIFPQEKITNVFEKKIRPILNKIYDNQNENISLSKLRDALLPKLISGEVRVGEKTIK